MKIAITGSTWFVWSYLVDFFAKNKENHIFAFNRKKEEKIKNIEYIHWDLKNFPEKMITCDIFIHSASETSYTKSKKEMIKNAEKMNKNILAFLKKSHCKHFILISSSSVYQWKNWIISTNEKIFLKDLENSYSYTKYISEQFFQKHLPKNIKISIIRPRAIYGKWDNVLVPNILKNQIFWRLILPGNGKNKTSITEINYFIKSIDSFIKNKKYGIFNDFSEIETYENLYKKIVKENNLKWIIKIPIFMFYFLKIFNKNKYSYIIDTFKNTKILVK